MLSGFSYTCCQETSNRDAGNDFGKNEDQKPTALKSSALNTLLLLHLLGDGYILEGLEFYCWNMITVLPGIGNIGLHKQTCREHKVIRNKGQNFFGENVKELITHQCMFYHRPGNQLCTRTYKIPQC